MSHKENIGWTKPILETWAKPCENERHIGSIKDLRPPRNNKLTFQLQRTFKTDLCGNFTPEPLCLLRRTDERPKGRNSCLRLRPRSVLVLSVSCWCLTKLIFTQKISFAEFSVATCRLKHPVRSHLCNLSFGKPLFRDTSIQETQNLFSYSLYLSPLLKGDLNSAERDTISGSQNLVLTAIQGTPWFSKRDWPQRRLISLVCTNHNDESFHKDTYFSPGGAQGSFIRGGSAPRSQPRPQGFSLKKWEKGKALGRRLPVINPCSNMKIF